MSELMIGDGCGLKLEIDSVFGIAAFNSGGAHPSTLRSRAVDSTPLNVPLISDDIQDIMYLISRGNTLHPGLDAGHHWIDKINAFSVSTTDAMTPPTSDPRSFGRIAALHVLSDLWVAGVDTDTMQQYLVLPAHNDTEMLGSILDGFKETCDQFEIKITGGHTRKEGSQYLVGGTATGYTSVRRDTTSPRNGDLVVVTKSLGTSVAIAAGKMIQHELASELPNNAREVIESADSSMMTDNHIAVKMRLERLVRACTDITGFGLMGHLSNLLNPVDKGAEVVLSQLPIIEGVSELLEAGVHTHVGDSAQIIYAERTYGSFDALNNPYFHLAFLPETSGGILATVAPGLVDSLASLVRENGQKLTVIGEVTPKSPNSQYSDYRFSGINLKQDL